VAFSSQSDQLTRPGEKCAPGLPLVEEITPLPCPEEVFIKLSRQPHCLFLDSALRDKRLGRYSFVTCDPFDYLELPANGSDGLDQLQRRMANMISDSLQDFPPFQGGAAGLFSYDLARSLERLPTSRFDEFGVPALAIGFYDVVIAFDHQENRAWLISQGFPEQAPHQRRQRAAQRLAQFRQWLAEPAEESSESRVSREGALPAIASSELAPQFAVESFAGLTSNFSPPGYLTAIGQAIDYIYAGDLFQVNVAQRLLYPARDDSVTLYQRLRQRNAATFAGYFDLGDFQIVSASPERFLQVRDSLVEARPIKGTRQRISRPEADLFAGSDLQQSEKDRAENVMIVDLLRNDLSRVCHSDSVQVTQLCHLEVYQYVQHLVSAVCGQLSTGVTPIDVLRAAFPGGSITGAPKVRAMEIIAELEPTARGPYCGSLGYIGFDGSMDMSILIRTITAGRGWWQMPVGGGIVAQSDPQNEYEETWHKAKGMITALQL